MTFKFSDQHIIERHSLGYTVFRQIIPPSLLRDLRRACEPVHGIARKSGPRAMRLTGVARHGLDCQAFKDYAQLPALNDAVSRVLNAPHTYGDTGGMAILIETADIPVTQAWHRDAVESQIPEEHRAEFNRAVLLPTLINQVNCPLYEDSALWYVPGSHIRANLPSEVAASKSTILVGDHFTNEERERLGVQYCRGMPGATCLAMDAGGLAPWVRAHVPQASHHPRRGLLAGVTRVVRPVERVEGGTIPARPRADGGEQPLIPTRVVPCDGLHDSRRHPWGCSET
ncbi:MAG: hypothetical protein NTW19_08675 [Planctomycetota bacterium]|nr:hypothetical protein [Planctomycetota bacterium]